MRKILLLLAMFMGFSYLAICQTRTVTGTVVDETANPIPFASIAVKGTSSGVSADADGNFSIQAGPGATLVVSATGYSSKEVAAIQTTLSVVLQKGDAQVIEEVIVTATGQKVNRKIAGYSATTVSSDRLVQAAPTNVATALSGKVPGLQINITGSGVNPNVSVVLRGYRSITGNNQALIVLDNVIVPNEMLGNLNPNDVDNITVLNGASAAALYGSRASNGALIVTTKKGVVGGKPSFVLSQTFTRSSVSFYPKLQKRFGSGSNGYFKVYDPVENQQYGPEYDGSMVNLGDYPLPGGKIQQVKYAFNEDEGKLKFFEPETSSQTDFSISSPTGKGRIYFSGQFVSNKGVIEGDSYKRSTVSVGGSQKVLDNFDFDYGVRYTQNYTRQSTVTNTMYDLILNSPGQVPITRYKNWQVDSFSMPNYYYNAYYNNPYFMKDNYRSSSRNEYLVGNLSLKWAPYKWVDLVGKVGMTSRNYSAKSWSNKYLYNAYAKANTHGSYKKSDILGGVGESMFYTNSLVSDIQAMFKKTNVPNWDFKLNIGAQLIQDDRKDLNASISGLGLPDVFNLGNLTTVPSADESIRQSRTIGVYAEAYFTNKKYGTTLHLTGRRDHVSILDPGFNVFYYPSADLSFVASDVIPALKNSNAIKFLKIRASIANTGNVNLGPYSTEPSFGQSSGYPYGGVVAYTIGNQLVQKGLKPEFTLGKEVGFEFDLYKRVTGDFTYYVNETKNQTLPVQISQSSGFYSLLTNVGLTRGTGVEASLNVKVIDRQELAIAIGANYTYNDNKVVDLGIKDISRIQLLNGLYAANGKPFPSYFGTTHLRDSATGKVIVDRYTGLPSTDNNIKYLGNTQPLHRMGINLDAFYKGLNLRVLTEYRGGYIIYAGAGPSYDFSGAGYNTALFDRERFVFPNSVYKDPVTGKYVDNTSITVVDGNSGGSGYWTQATPRRGINENYVISGDFWKLREVSLSYSLPDRLFQNLKAIKGASVNIYGRNLVILVPKDNIYATDPEYSDNTGNYIGLTSLNQTPPSRFYGVTFTLKF
ncbi:SusC/RagA family TonB-linked outer membrane protein [Niabella sp. 22666]|uniref:SusC/RagA family TonB-linked outer membrane protein n=1 Tax=Niabella sp. 22666 TaxID=3453954 RepID=UPI003F82EDA3